MSLRDYFAAQAMQAYIARIPGANPSNVASDSYLIADVMLGERERRP